MNVLILSISAGYAYTGTAEAIKEYMENNICNVKVEILDILRYINPLADELVKNGYLALERSFSSLYNNAETSKDRPAATDIAYDFINDFLLKKLRYSIDNFLPDIIICTHPLHCKLLSSLKTENAAAVMYIITDFSTQYFCAYNYVDAYIVHNTDIAQCLANLGIPENKIYPLGIPVKRQNLRQYDKDYFRRKYNLNYKTTVMIIGENLRMNLWEKILYRLLNSQMDIQIIVTAGSSNTLNKQLKEMALDTDKKVVSSVISEDIPDLLAISDLVISKPDGFITSQAMIERVPIVIISPLPGYEENNADYLFRHNIAVEVEKDVDIAAAIEDFIKDSNKISFIKSSMENMAKPFAARDICNLAVALRKEC